MRDVLKRGTDWLGRKLRDHASHMVVYVRGVQSVPLLAVPAQSELEQSEAGGLRVAHSDQDWLLKASDLVLGGLHSLPAAGDRIEDRLDDGRLAIYEVMQPDGNSLPYRLMDSYGSMIRVHSRRVSTQ